MHNTSSLPDSKILNHLLEHSNDLICIFNERGESELISSSVESILGYKKEELIGQSYTVFIHPSDLKITSREKENIQDKVPSLNFENRCLHKNGNTVYLQWASSYDQHSRKVYGIARDITAAKHKSQAEKLEHEINRALIDGTDNLVWSLDKNYCFTGFNKAFKESREKEYSATIEIGLNTFESMNFSPELIDEWKPIYSQVFEGKHLNFEYNTAQIEKDKEKIKWHKIELKPIISDDEVIGLIGISIDVTDLKKTALALTERNQLIESVIKEIPMGVAVNEIDSGNTIFVNEQFSQTYNWPVSDLENVDNFLNKIYPSVNKEAHRISKQVVADIKSGDPSRMVWSNIPIQGQDDKTRYVNAKNIPLYDQNLMISTVTDNTDLYFNKLALEVAYLEKKDILDSISDAFYTLDEAYNFTFLNKHSLDIMGMSYENLIGKNLFSVFPELKETLFFEQLELVSRTKEAAKFEFDYKQFNTWFDERIYKTADGFSVFYVDITIRKQFEIELGKLNQSLEQKNDELEQFAYVASHDLQEPLRSISSFMDLLKMHFGDALDETAKKYIDFSIDGSNRMKQIIKDLLDYSKAGSVEENITKINCNELIKEVITLLEAPIESKKATITFDELPKIKYNATALRQVFMNLIGNALKYVQNGDEPNIHISAQQVGRHYEFQVSDNGIGIDPKHHSHIFTIFKRLHNKSEYSGTGIGLAICKKIIEKYNGKISLQSQIGKGTTFKFTIPQNIQ